MRKVDVVVKMVVGCLVNLHRVPKHLVQSAADLAL